MSRLQTVDLWQAVRRAEWTVIYFGSEMLMKDIRVVARVAFRIDSIEEAV